MFFLSAFPVTGDVICFVILEFREFFRPYCIAVSPHEVVGTMIALCRKLTLKISLLTMGFCQKVLDDGNVHG